MIILSFDSAVNNLGLCCINFDDKYYIKLYSCIWRLIPKIIQLKFLLNIKIINTNHKVNSLINFLHNILTIIKKISCIITNIISIIYINNVNLISKKSAKSTTLLERTTALKSVLNSLDRLLPMPNIILIEYQMRQNYITQSISHQIAYHYANIYDCDISNGLIKNNMINLTSHNSLFNKKRTIYMIPPSLKKSCILAPNGKYSNFIQQWSNYTANKKQADFNFKYFIQLFNQAECIEILKQFKKTNDIADAFIIIICWLKKIKKL